MEFIKYLIAKFVRNIFKLLIFTKIKDKILFYPSNGNYYCNLKYISNELLEKNNKNNKNMIWTIKEKIKINNILSCRKFSLMFFYYFFSSRIIIYNDTLPSYLIKRKGQVFIQTWHGGGAYKKINSLFKDEPNKYKKIRREYICKNIDYIISSCKSFTKAFKNDYGATNAEYLEFGMPRNDIFFDKDKVKKTIENVKKYYKLNEDNKVILYAPTFRAGDFNNYFEVDVLLNRLKNNYKQNFVLMLRTHPHLKENIFNNKTEFIIDVTSYPDMQELLCAADILITDYSSCMWDFSLMYKPCFIYATDIDQYKQERDFYTPMSEWPFPIATNTDELVNNILNFNEEEYVAKVKQHHQALGSFEDGHACERVCKLIEDILDGKV